MKSTRIGLAIALLLIIGILIWLMNNESATIVSVDKSIAESKQVQHITSTPGTQTLTPAVTTKENVPTNQKPKYCRHFQSAPALALTEDEIEKIIAELAASKLSRDDILLMIEAYSKLSKNWDYPLGPIGNDTLSLPHPYKGSSQNELEKMTELGDLGATRIVGFERLTTETKKWIRNLRESAEHDRPTVVPYILANESFIEGEKLLLPLCANGDIAVCNGIQFQYRIAARSLWKFGDKSASNNWTDLQLRAKAWEKVLFETGDLDAALMYPHRDADANYPENRDGIKPIELTSEQLTIRDKLAKDIAEKLGRDLQYIDQQRKERLLWLMRNNGLAEFDLTIGVQCGWVNKS